MNKTIKWIGMIGAVITGFSEFFIGTPPVSYIIGGVLVVFSLLNIKDEIEK